MSQYIYVGYNTRAKPNENVYPNYLTADEAFNDITASGRGMYQKGPYDAPLHWRQDDTVEFVVDSAYNGTETYCAWEIDGDNEDYLLRKYGFGAIIGSEYVGVKGGNKLFKYVARRDYLMEYLPSMSFSQCNLTRYTVPKSLDTWGAFPQEEPVAERTGLISEKTCYPFSGVLDTREDFVYLVTMILLPYQTSSESKWETPEIMKVVDDTTNLHAGIYASLSRSYVVVTGSGTTISEATSENGLRNMLKLITEAGIEVEKYISRISLVPLELITSSSYTTLRGQPHIDAPSFTLYKVRTNGLKKTFDWETGAGGGKKSSYYDKSVKVIGTTGEELLLFQAYDCYVNTDDNTGTLLAWTTFHDSPVLHLCIRGSNDSVTLLDNPESLTGRLANIDLPTISTSSDTFKDWWRSNAIGMGSSILNGVLGVAQVAAGIASAVGTAGASTPVSAGMIISGVGALAGTGASVGNLITKTKELKASSISTRNLVGSKIDVYGALFSILVFGPCDSGNAEDDTRLGQQLRRWGYSVGSQQFIPKKDNGSYWTFIQGQVSLKSDKTRNMPTERAYNYIIQAFQNGVTFWNKTKMSNFGDFTKANLPTNN